ncbi:hypothetical protein OUZ56_032584 [Daphnia magna]|uniref:LigA n=1 Tax=Daphnia magna TaxID=35525 RepID=A0ABR0B9C1_9CRUS|nr:hypothetical protein OUZ56_032584 [Daphnia magna]
MSGRVPLDSARLPRRRPTRSPIPENGRPRGSACRRRRAAGACTGRASSRSSGRPVRAIPSVGSGGWELPLRGPHTRKLPISTWGVVIGSSRAGGDRPLEFRAGHLLHARRDRRGGRVLRGKEGVSCRIRGRCRDGEPASSKSRVRRRELRARDLLQRRLVGRRRPGHLGPEQRISSTIRGRPGDDVPLGGKRRDSAVEPGTGHLLKGGAGRRRRAFRLEPDQRVSGAVRQRGGDREACGAERRDARIELRAAQLFKFGVVGRRPPRVLVADKRVPGGVGRRRGDDEARVAERLHRRGELRAGNLSKLRLVAARAREALEAQIGRGGDARIRARDHAGVGVGHARIGIDDAGIAATVPRHHSGVGRAGVGCDLAPLARAARHHAAERPHHTHR